MTIRTWHLRSELVISRTVLQPTSGLAGKLTKTYTKTQQPAHEHLDVLPLPLLCCSLP